MSYIKKSIFWSKTPGNIVNKLNGKTSAFKSHNVDFTLDEWNQTFSALVLNEIKFDYTSTSNNVYINKGIMFSKAATLLQETDMICSLERQDKIKYVSNEFIEQENSVFVSLDNEEYIKFVVLN